METKFLDSSINLGSHTKLYRKSFFTAGELLETYLLKDEKVIYPIEICLIILRFIEHILQEYRCYCVNTILQNSR